MNNRTIDVVSVGDDALALALRLAWANAAGGQATHYKDVRLITKYEYHGTPTAAHYANTSEQEGGIATLMLLWHDERQSIALPYPLELDEATAFVLGWLKRADYGHQPDHDGDNEKGWRAFNEDWGHVAGHHYAIIAIQPAWAMYGK